MTTTFRSLPLVAAALVAAAAAVAITLNFSRTPVDTSYPSTTFPNIRQPVDVGAADIDSDGDIDLVGSITHIAGTGEGVYWYQNNGSFAFTKTLIDTTLGDDDIDGVRFDVADIDDDLDSDIVLCGADNLFLYENSGGTFTRTTIDAITGALRLARIADLDGDTDEDVVFLSNNGIYWRQNDGSENFPSRLTIDANPVVDVALVVANLDTDSDIDIVSSTVDVPSGNRYFAWYENLGGGVFTRHIFDVLVGTEDLSDVFVADVDRDGLLDLTLAKPTNNEIWWYEDTGAHIFFPHLVSNTFSPFPARVWVTDLDNDSDRDIIAIKGNGPAGEVAYWENDGEEAFAFHSIDATGGRRNGLLVADIDRDTLDDIFATSISPSELVWYNNLGTGTAVGNPIADASLSIYANIPNPFNPSTTIRFEVHPAASVVDVDVFSINGVKVRTLLHDSQEEGYHEVRWDGRDDYGLRVASGVYIARVHANGVTRSLKMTLLM